MRGKCILGIFGFLGLAFLFLPGYGKGKTPPPLFNVTLDFQTGSMNPYGTLKLSDGETFTIEIIGLKGGYDTYDIQVLGTKSEAKAESKPGEKTIEKETPPQATITVIHSSEYSAYQVVVKKKPEEKKDSKKEESGGTTPPAKDDYNNRTWVIPVFTHGWALDFCGGFVMDSLTSPVYYLDPITGTSPQSFNVKENKDARDHFSLGAVAMVHLYHTKRLQLFSEISWAPISFGLGFGTNTEARYYFGTSLRFADKLFLTGGASLGAINVYAKSPAASGDSPITTDANALSGLAKKNSWGWFISVSYAFAGTQAKEKLMQPFTSTSQ